MTSFKRKVRKRLMAKMCVPPKHKPHIDIKMPMKLISYKCPFKIQKMIYRHGTCFQPYGCHPPPDKHLPSSNSTLTEECSSPGGDKYGG